MQLCTSVTLMFIFGLKQGIPPIVAARLTMWAMKLSAYSYEIQFCQTDEHGNADGLSRLPLHNVNPL